MYQLTASTNILRLSDGATIPADPNNGDYAAYLEWLAAGNTPEAIAVPTVADQTAINETAIQVALDAMARSRGYDGIASACTYASSTPTVPSTDPHFATCEKFRLEGNALQAWKSVTWATAFAYLATVTAGTNPMLTPAQAVAMIPAFTWPD